jgi:hypothetical protein
MSNEHVCGLEEYGAAAEADACERSCLNSSKESASASCFGARSPEFSFMPENKCVLFGVVPKKAALFFGNRSFGAI